MTVVFLFALTLFLAVLISNLAERSALSTAVLFLAAGIFAGPAGIGLVHLRPEAPVVSEIATLALFAILFTDGMRVGVRDLASSWRLPGRALILGLPLTMLGTALLAHGFAGLGWRSALLLGAVLAPTDPVFAAALVKRTGLSQGLRHLLNVESGINDGLALPLVLWLARAAVGGGTAGLLVPLAVGVAVGVAVPWLADRLEGSRWFQAHESYRSMGGFAVALLVLSVAAMVHGNEFLAAFTAGVTVISVRPGVSREFREFVLQLADVLKFAGVFIFGALLAPSLLHDLGAGDYLFAFLALVAVRPVVLSLALLGSRLDWRERAVAAWFGPKGFASVLYAVLVLRENAPSAQHLFHLAALVITASIVIHSSTDVLAARWLLRGSGGRPVSPPRDNEPAT